MHVLVSLSEEQTNRPLSFGSLTSKILNIGWVQIGQITRREHEHGAERDVETLIT